MKPDMKKRKDSIDRNETFDEFLAKDKVYSLKLKTPPSKKLLPTRTSSSHRTNHKRVSQRFAAPADERARGRPFPVSVLNENGAPGGARGLRDPLPELARLRDRAPYERGCDARSRGAAPNIQRVCEAR
jgi:hypothetical protein